MPTVVTKANGGTAQPVGVLYIEPDRQVVDASAKTALTKMKATVEDLQKNQ